MSFRGRNFLSLMGYFLRITLVITLGYGHALKLFANQENADTGVKSCSEIKANEVSSIVSRTRYLAVQLAHILEQQKDILETQTPEDATRTLVEHLSEFIVIYSDRILQLLSSQKFNKTTHHEIYRELACITLEQIFPLAKRLGCLGILMEQISEENGSVYATIREKLRTKTMFIPMIKDDGESIKKEFSDEHTALILSMMRKISLGYGALFNPNKDPLNLDENDGTTHFTSDIASMAEKQGKNSGSLMPVEVLESFDGMMIHFIVSQSNTIAETFPEKPIFDIYTAIINITLQQILPVVTRMGLLWGFANTLKNDDLKSSFNKKLKEAFRENAPYILSQNGTVKEKKYIKFQIRHIRNTILEILKSYFEIFGKRETFGNIRSPV